MTKLLFASVTLAAFTLQAQAPNATAGLIRLSVAATNDAGEPVLDLKSGDFHITDQGKGQKIAFFQTNPGKAGAPKLAEREFSNRTQAPPHTTAILFDLLNVTRSDLLDTWHRLGHSLQQLESGDSVYLYVLTLEGNLEPVHPIGGKSGDDHTWTKTIEQTLDKAMKADIHARPAQMNDQELVVKKTYVALETLANQLTSQTGRRDIVWITSGMPNAWNPKVQCNGDWVDCALYVPHLAVTLAFDNVSINPVTYTGNPNPDITRDIEQISYLTGGSTFVAEDIRNVLQQISRDATSSYTVVYEVPPESLDNKFHKIRVTVNQKGVKLRVKQRYYAYADKTPEATKQHALLAGAFQNPVDDPTIGLHGTAAAAEPGKPLHIKVAVNTADLLLHDNHDTLTVLVADVGPSGPIGEPAMSTLNVTSKDEAIIAQDHPANASADKVRVIVLDQNADTVGSLTIPLK